MVKRGDVLQGKYLIENVVAQGDMSLVVAAHHLQLDQRVALKFMLPELMAEPQARVRFQREARVAVQLSSQHTARVFDVGEMRDGLPYIVMEYLTGKDLRTVLGERKRLPVETAVCYVLQACEAIAEAHALGVVHRDLKPANLFLTDGPDHSPLIKVLDFGVSKVPQSDGVRVTNSQDVLGSVPYSSPEQIMTPDAVDARTDIWSLGVTLHELVSGISPFKDTNPGLTSVKILYMASPSLAGRAGGLAPAFAAAVDRCLAKHPQDRFGNVADLAAGIAPYGGPTVADAPRRIARILNAGTADRASPGGPQNL
jgi:eukaryotic-like serine/threonine-protein kinase